MYNTIDGNNNTTLCSLLLEGLSDHLLYSQLIVLICTCILPIIINSAALYYLIKNNLLEYASKLLLGVLFLFNVLASLAIMINSFRISLAYAREPCRLIMAHKECEKINLLFILPIVGIHCTMSAIAIQRLNASMTYRKMRSRLLLAISLFIEAIVLILFLVDVGHADIDADERPCDSFAVVESDFSIYKALVAILMEKIAMVIFIYLHFSNRKKYLLTINQAANRLKIRYQLMLNIQLNKALLPSAFICFPGFLLADVLVITSSHKSHRNQALQSNFTHLVSVLCCTLQPLTFFAWNKWFRDPLKKDLLPILTFRSCRTKTKVSNERARSYVDDQQWKAAEMVTKKYFEDLASAWS